MRALIHSAGFPLCALLTLCALLSACQSAPPPQARELPKLHELRITGNKHLSAGTIASRIINEPASWWNPFDPKRPFDPSVLPADLARIAKLYETEGYYGTRVFSGEALARNDGQVDLLIQVEEAPATKVSPLRIVGFPPVPLPDDLDLVEGKRFRQEDYDSSKLKLENALKNVGYPKAKVEGSVQVSIGARTAEVTYTISPGPQTRIGRIEIDGTKVIPVAPLKDITSLEVGALVSVDAVEEARRKLARLGVFSTVEARVQEADEHGHAPVRFQVIEGTFQSLSAGAGVGIENRRQEVRARVGYQHNNFLGGLRRLDTEFRPAYITVPRLYAPDHRGLGGQVRASLLQPDFLARLGVHNLGWVNTLSARQDLEDVYTVRTGTARTGLAWPSNSDSYLQLGYNFEVFRLSRLPASLSECQSRVCRLGFIDAGFVFDRRDEKLLPSKGYWATIDTHFAGAGGEFSYLKVLPEARYYRALTPSLIAAARVQFGALWQAQGSMPPPLPRRFYAGGAGNHRGFARNRLAPQAPIPGGKRSIATGGGSLAVLNLEVRRRFLEMLYGVAFLDTGDVQEGRGVFTHPQWNTAAGVGVLLQTPVMPLRLDVGYRLNAPARFRDEARIAFNLALGETF